MENSKKIFALLIEGGNIADKVIATKQWTAIAEILDEVFALQSVEWSELMPEMISLKESGNRDEMVEFFKEKFDLLDDEIEAKIEKGLEIVEKLSGIVIEIIAFSKSFSSK